MQNLLVFSLFLKAIVTISGSFETSNYFEAKINSSQRHKRGFLDCLYWRISSLFYEMTFAK